MHDKILEEKRPSEKEDVIPLTMLCAALEKKHADKHWLVTVLSVCDPENDIFKKDYVYERQRKRLRSDALPVLDNEDGFFDHLPQLPFN